MSHTVKLSLMGPDEKRNGGIVSAIAEKLN
jgi:hypothetical protein